MRRALPALLLLLLAAPAAFAVTDGDLDAAYAASGVRRVAFDLAGDDRDFAQGLAREPSGNYVIAGEVEQAGGTGMRVGVARISRSSGNLIQKYDADTFFSAVRALAVDSIGRPVVVGITPSNADGRPDLGVLRFFGTSPDAGFAGDGAISFDSDNTDDATDEPLAVVVRENGEIIVLIREVPFGVANPAAYVLVRIPVNGQAPTALPLGNTTAGFLGGTMLLQPDGKLVVVVNVSMDGGLCHRPRVFRFAPGTLVNLDSTLNGSGLVTLAPPVSTGQCAPAVNAVALDAQGRLLLGATSRSLAASASWVARMNVNGALDASFSADGWMSIPRPAGGSFHDVYGIGVQRDGKIVTAGTFTYDNAAIGDRPIVSRINANGSIDAGFNGVGSHVYTPPVGNANPQNAIALLMDGDRAVIAGSYRANAPLDYDFQLLRTAGPLLGDSFE